MKTKKIINRLKEIEELIPSPGSMDRGTTSRLEPIDFVKDKLNKLIVELENKTVDYTISLVSPKGKEEFEVEGEPIAEHLAIRKLKDDLPDLKVFLKKSTGYSVDHIPSKKRMVWASTKTAAKHYVEFIRVIMEDMSQETLKVNPLYLNAAHDYHEHFVLEKKAKTWKQFCAKAYPEFLSQKEREKMRSYSV